MAADPTLKDVLAAIAKLPTKADLSELRSDLADLRSEMGKRFDEIDAELTTHAKVHREIEKDITALKGRPARTPARAGRRR